MMASLTTPDVGDSRSGRPATYLPHRESADTEHVLPGRVSYLTDEEALAAVLAISTGFFAGPEERPDPKCTCPSIDRDRGEP